MRSALTREDFEKVYFLLSGPALHGDCGDLCGRMCCQEYEPGVGMYLIPGEECMFTGKEPWLKWRYQWAKNHDFPPEWDGLVQFVVCKGICPRERRPVQCRTFPLMPYLDTSGNLDARLDALNGSLICPLVRSSNKHSLRPEFVENVLEAWKILLKDPLVRADVAQQSRNLDQDEDALWRRLLVRWRNGGGGGSSCDGETPAGLLEAELKRFVERLCVLTPTLRTARLDH